MSKSVHEEEFLNALHNPVLTVDWVPQPSPFMRRGWLFFLTAGVTSLLIGASLGMYFNGRIVL